MEVKKDMEKATNPGNHQYVSTPLTGNVIMD
jgi:hypothetical protein